MARMYQKHGILALIKRQGRRRGDIDGRTRIAKDCEEVRTEIVNKRGGQDVCPPEFLVTVQLLKSHLAKRGEIEEARLAYLRDHPPALSNPRALATLNSYSFPHDKIIIDLLNQLKSYPAVFKAPVKTLADVLAETTDEQAKTSQDGQGGALPAQLDQEVEPPADHVATVQDASRGAENEKGG